MTPRPTVTTPQIVRTVESWAEKRFLGTAAVGFASFHGLVLMGDRYVSFPLRAIVVPFAADYEPVLVAGGQIAFWLSALLIGSFHVRRQIGGRVWRRLHYASFVAFWLAFVHGLALGSESATLWASFLYLGTAAPVLFLSLQRVLPMPSLCRLLIGGAQSA